MKTLLTLLLPFFLILAMVIAFSYLKINPFKTNYPTPAPTITPSSSPAPSPTHIFPIQTPSTPPQIPPSSPLPTTKSP